MASHSGSHWRMPHGLHVPRARQLDALEAQLGHPMDLGHCGLDVAVRQAGQPDVAVGIVAAEVAHPGVVDAQHLVGGLAVVQLGRGGQDAVDHLGVDAVAIHLLDAQMRVARPPDPLLAVLVQTGGRHHVDPELLAGDVLRARGAHAARQAEGGSVVGDPSPPVRPVGDVGHPILQRPGRLRHEQVRGQPDEVEVTVRRDPVVAHARTPPCSDAPATPIARRPAGAPPARRTSLMTSRTRVCNPGYSIPNSLASRL